MIVTCYFPRRLSGRELLPADMNPEIGYKLRDRRCHGRRLPPRTEHSPSGMLLVMPVNGRPGLGYLQGVTPTLPPRAYGERGTRSAPFCNAKFFKNCRTAWDPTFLFLAIRSSSKLKSTTVCSVRKMDGVTCIGNQRRHYPVIAVSGDSHNFVTRTANRVPDDPKNSTSQPIISGFKRARTAYQRVRICQRPYHGHHPCAHDYESHSSNIGNSI